jgi:beta-glucosidase
LYYNGSWDLTGPASNLDAPVRKKRILKAGGWAHAQCISVEATTEAQKLVMENSSLKIPLLFGYDVIHGYSTIFPVPLGETASWDLEAIEEGHESLLWNLLHNG